MNEDLIARLRSLCLVVKDVGIEGPDAANHKFTCRFEHDPLALQAAESLEAQARVIAELRDAMPLYDQWMALGEMRTGAPLPGADASPDASLKPCPFCGSSARIRMVDDDRYVDTPDFGGCYVSCDGCAASSVLRFPLMVSVDRELTEAWNRRQPAPTKAASAPEDVSVEMSREILP